MSANAKGTMLNAKIRMVRRACLTSAFSLQQSAFPPVRPISDHGNGAEIAQRFGGFEKLGAAVNQLQSLLYAA
jgi:hypothetical protein